ncbi:MAG: hypothetical protein PHO75_03495 [Candidatus Shapirobacteria bacterium]|nr:hypothetical protein [Candidatus Shapirobacteria bacterium]
MFGFNKKKIDPNCAEEILRRRQESLVIIEEETGVSNIARSYANNDKVDRLIKHLIEGTDDDLYRALCMLEIPKTKENAEKVRNASTEVKKVK